LKKPATGHDLPYNILPAVSRANLQNGIVAAGFSRTWKFKATINGVVQSQVTVECVVVGQSDTQEYEDAVERGRKLRVQRLTLRPLSDIKLGIKMGDSAIGPDNVEFIIESINSSDVPRIECVKKDTLGLAGNDGFLAVGKVNP
jgi:hypothetical protein